MPKNFVYFFQYLERNKDIFEDICTELASLEKKIRERKTCNAEAMMLAEVPSLARPPKRLRAEPDESNVEFVDDEQEWQIVGKHGKPKSRVLKKNLSAETPGMVRETVIFKPKEGAAMKSISGKNIKSVIDSLGIPPDGITAKVNEKSNTIAITTRNPLTVKKILEISSFPATDGEIHTTAYQALGSNQSRGVIYLRNEVTEEDAKELKEDIRCRSHDIVMARPMGKRGTAILVTFEGKIPPRRVYYGYESYAVAPYNPRPVICIRCQRLGHKSDACPNEPRCDGCGEIHPTMDECTTMPKCINCGGPHVALCPNCPKRAIPVRRRQPMQRENKPQSTRLRQQQPSTSGEREVTSQGTISIAAQNEQAPTPRQNVWNNPLQERWRDAQAAEVMPKGEDFDVKKEIQQLNQKFNLILALLQNGR